MKNKHLAWLAVSSLVGIPAAHADIELIATGNISGTYEDLAHNSAKPLENGVPGDRLGGMGSGLAYAGGTTFLALPDRGPNAVPFNSAFDDTTSYIERFHTLDLSLLPSDAGSPFPFTLTPTLRSTTLLFSRTPLVYGTGAGLGVGSGAPALNFEKHRSYFSGRSDNFDASRLSTNPNNGRLDAESIRVSRDGRSVFISDEYGPYVYQFDRASGARLRAYKLPEKFGVANLSTQGAVEISGNTSGRVANKGMEGLAIAPDGRTLFGAMQSPLIQDGGTDGPVTRIVKIDVFTGITHEYGYPLTNIGTATKPKYSTVSDIVAVNDHQFLVDERDGKGLGDNSTAVFKRLYLIDLTGAEDVSGISGGANLATKAVTKKLFVDMVAVLNAAGFASIDIPAKLEGVAFGPDVTVAGATRHTVFVANDNDYIATVTDTNHPSGMDNPNRWFVFAFGDTDLPGYTPQKIDELDCGDHGFQD
ncbi:MAG: esterase-like activity of phytase family protein [Steroidobacteraceae bacterium]